MKTLEELTEVVTAWEEDQIANELPIGYYSDWGNTLFSEIMGICQRFGLKKTSTDTIDEIIHRVDDWATFTTDFEDSEGRLRKMDAAFKIIDTSFNLSTHEAVFGNETVEQILQRWKEEEEWEKEEEIRQECIDFCTKIAFIDGSCDTYDEAYDLARMVCK